MSQPTERPEPSRQQQLAERRARLSSAQQALLGKWAKRKAGEAPAATSIPRRPAGEPGAALPLSFAQQRMWFLHQLEPWNPEYHVPAALEARGPLDVAVLRSALGEVVSRHEVLRTRFAEAGDGPVQIVEPPRPQELPVIDLAALPHERRGREQERLVAEEAVRLFDLDRGPFLRTTVLRCGEAEHVLLVSQHHIVSDGWSTQILVRELGTLYSALSAGEAASLAELPVQYADFALWQRSWLKGEVLERQLAYWREKLAGVEPLGLPTDRPRPAIRSGRGATTEFTLPAALYQGLEKRARGQGASLFMVTLAAFQTLLHRYTGQCDVAVGTPIAGRRWKEVEQLIGFFVNTLVLRSEVRASHTFRELVDEVRATALAAYSHQDVPFEQLVEQLQPRRDRSRTPFFQVVFVLQNAAAEPVEMEGVDLSPVDMESGTAKFDVTLILAPEPGGKLVGWLEYAVELFDRTTVLRLGEHLKTLLAAIAARPEETVGTVELLCPAEAWQLRGEWCSAPAPAPAAPEGVCAHRLFEAQAARTPDAPALYGPDGRELAYRELDERSNQLAHRLRHLGVGPEGRVAIFMERSPELVVATLAVHKAGAAYVPLDPSAPRDRLAFQAEDSAVSLVLTRESLRDRLPAVPALAVDLASWSLAEESREGLSGGATAAGLAYVIYTSGSTGRPKGVAVSHAALGNLVAWHLDTFAVGPRHRATLVAGPAFDASVWEQWPYLAAGASLHVADAETVASAPALVAWLAEQEITHCFLPTPLAEEVLRLEWPAATALEVLLTGGDRLRQGARSDLPWRLVNNYGPTENTVVTTSAPVGLRGNPPIGRPLPGVGLRLVDRGLRPVPAGVAAEVVVSGAGLARGYLGRPGLTARSFVPNPFAGGAGARLYRTGDLARHLADGQVDFLDRVDHQVKIRGFRIELGEIEAAITGEPGVLAAAVLAWPAADGDRRLVAYVALEPEAAADEAGIKSALRAKLPGYMVPAHFVRMDRLPLSPNGKVDRKALPEPDATVSETAYVAPRTPTEERLAEIWADLLGVGRVGVEDDFFELGGHSLLATRVVSRMRALGVTLPVSALFDAPRIGALAARIDAASRQDLGGRIEPSSSPPVTSFAQERLWFLDRLDPGTAAYNMPTHLRLRGRLDAGALRRSLQAVVDRHEVLRTRFDELGGRPVPVAGRLALPLPLADLTALPAAAREAAVRELAAGAAGRAFDLARGPLLDARLLRLAAGTPDREEHVFLLNLHHVAGDGWSLGVLVREVAAVYRALVSGEEPELDALPIRYTDFAAWQRRLLQGEELERQLAYWRERLTPPPPALALPLDRPRPAVQTYRGERRGGCLPAATASALRSLARREGASLFMVLAAAFQVLLSRLSGQEDVLVGYPTAGRDRPELEGLVGIFLNTLVLRTDLARPASFEELLRQVRGEVLGAIEHQDVPFEKVLEEIHPERDLSRTPVFQVMFNMLNLPSSELRLPGLTLEMGTAVETPSKFDLTVYTSETPEREISFQVVYNADLFDGWRIEEMLAQYRRILEQVAADPGVATDRLSLVTPAAAGRLPDPREPLASEWRGTIPGRIRERATPAERPAVVDGSEAWTYGELLASSSVLAAEIRGAGLGPGDVVAIDARRSARLVPAILGVLEAGAAFLVLDPSYPAGRRLELARRARARGWVRLSGDVDPELAAGLGDLAFDVPPRTARAVPVAGVEVGPDTPAYVAFTSGSTGEPKGIVGGHGPVVHFLDWHTSTFELTSEDRFSMLSGLAHDPLLRDVFTPLWVGATLYVPDPEEIGTPGWLADWMRAAQIRVAHLTPAMGRLLTEGVAVPIPSPRALFFSGDRLRATDLARLRELLPQALCVNFYGATETPQAMSWHVARSEEPREVLPLGRGIDGVQVLVRHRAGEPAGIGEFGEITIRTPYLAQGYLDEPFTGDEYRTGDLGRYRGDGEVDFVGRADDQVQIRGFRVEPGEVEASLGAHPQVTSAAVLPVDGSLVAFVATAAEPSSLSAHLRERLPAYMVPRSFVVLEALPLLPTGKVDRKALLALAAPAEVGRVGLVGPVGPVRPARLPAAPRTPVEEVVAAIFGELLGLAAVPVDGDFFALGGHSLLATQALARLRDALGVELSVRRIFAAPTVAGLAAEVEAAARRRQGLSTPPIERCPRDGEIPLSFSQERLWFLALLEPESPAYNVFTVLRLRGELDEDAFRAGFAEIVRRHETLRTTFAAAGGRPVQRIAPAEEAAASLPLELKDLRALSGDERRAEERILLEQSVREPFDLTAGPLFRVLLLRLADDVYAGTLVLHHIVSDGWSTGVLIRELAVLYGAFREGTEPVLGELPVQYADYALWQRRWLDEKTLESLLGWWVEQLAGAPAALDLPTDRPRPTVPSGRGALFRFELADELLKELKNLGRQEGATLFMSLLTGFKALMSRYCGQRDMVVGTPVANRSRVELEGLIGFFVNTLVLRTDLSAGGGSGPEFRQALGRVRHGALGAWAHHDLPFERLVEELRPRRDLARTPLFQVMFVLQNAPAERLELPGLLLEPLPAERGTARFDLLLTLAETADGLSGSLEYSTDLYDETTAARLTLHLKTLLAAAARAPETRLDALPLLSAAEEHQLAEWNATGAAYEPWPSLHRLVEAQVGRTPDAVALRFEGESLGYREVNARANRLAHHLRRLGVGQDTLVGVAAERSFELVIALLGVLKSGGAYVPMDPGYPRERLAFMLEDSAVPVLLTQERLVAELPEPPAGTRVVCLDTGWDEIAAASCADPPWHGTPESLAYMIYTSGSTGRPKGAMVAHRAIVNRLQWMQEAYGLTPADRVLQKTPFSFDVSVWEFFWPLLTGARLVVARPGGHQDPAYLARLIAGEEVTTMHFVPSMLQAFVEQPGVEACGSLRRVVASGEALPYDLEQRFFARLGSCELHNLYGPTEAAVDVTYEPCSVSEARQTVAIGRPIANLRIHLLDRRLRPVGLGVAGELLIAGVGLGRGYLKRPGLSAEKFVPDPSAAEPGGRAYKTGDLARHLPDGKIEYLGRLDHQVKVRGFRIELGEIEACLSALPEIRETVVTAREDVPGDARIVAWVVPHVSVEDVSVERLRAALAETLPEYMVPSAFAVLEALPLNPSGKADRAALAREPLPVPGAAGRRQGLAPRDATELELVRIWEEVLATSPIGVRDDFFELGGHSLSAVRVLGRIEERLGRSPDLQAFFRGATVESLARQLRGGTAAAASCLVELQSGTAAQKPPFVFVHPAGGDVLAYLPLARALGRESTVHALRSVGLDDGAEPLERVSDMASRYVAEVLAAWPRGPHVLVGWSFGGLVAYEMAHRLRRGGHEVAGLVLLDTAVPRPAGEEELPYDDDAFWLADVAAFLAAMEGREPPVSYEDLKAQPPAGQIRRFLSALTELDFLPPGIGEVRVRRLLRVYKANIRASRLYTPAASDERVVLLRAAEGDTHAASHSGDPTLGWGKLVARLEVHTVPGGHLTLLGRDHVGELAEILRRLPEGNP